jgi:hypothetical protein
VAEKSLTVSKKARWLQTEVLLLPGSQIDTLGESAHRVTGESFRVGRSLRAASLVTRGSVNAVQPPGWTVVNYAVNASTMHVVACE